MSVLGCDSESAMLVLPNLLVLPKRFPSVVKNAIRAGRFAGGEI